MRIKVKLGEKGQLVIPKIVREHIGLHEKGYAVIEVKEKSLEIKPLTKEDIVKEWREIAERYGGDLIKLGWVYGDKLYEEEFG
ncbi:MAG: AbrB/MazE/SpoVT family DNA-binding domain-containing protein [Candidatus Bathyarchaeia archaeon]|nr:AbrB/MazE/SpoVT family DNA-binding domain-containing protein [Candidatus Bathyarchaeota archaeon]